MSSTEALRSKNKDLYDLQAQLLSTPRSQRSKLKAQVSALDQQICELKSSLSSPTCTSESLSPKAQASRRPAPSTAATEATLRRLRTERKQQEHLELCSLLPTPNHHTRDSPKATDYDPAEGTAAQARTDMYDLPDACDPLERPISKLSSSSPLGCVDTPQTIDNSLSPPETEEQIRNRIALRYKLFRY